MPGGESTTMSRLLRVFGLETALRQRLAGGLPCLATCAGLILLSRHIDAGGDQLSLGLLDITVRRNGWGRQVDSFEADLDVTGLATPLRGVFIRAPRIESCGDGVEVLARHDGEPVAVRQNNITGLTFHPEMTGDIRIHEMFVAGVRTGVAV
jgi:pyridoxal 5'-phosphate synthase pdxT subunit